MKDPTKAVIFDLGNVLIDFDHMIAAKKIAKFSDKEGKEIFDLFFDSELTNAFEEGKVSPQDFFTKVKETLNLKISYDEFVRIWNAIFFLSNKNLRVYNLAYDLKSRCKVVVLSNINVLHYEHIKKTFPVFDAFHRVVASCELGLRKPQREIYQKTLQMLKVSPHDCFYTDDRPELVESAKSLGIRGFVFKNVEQLKKDLQLFGISIN